VVCGDCEIVSSGGQSCDGVRCFVPSIDRRAIRSGSCSEIDLVSGRTCGRVPGEIDISRKTEIRKGRKTKSNRQDGKSSAGFKTAAAHEANTPALCAGRWGLAAHVSLGITPQADGM